MRGAGDGSRHCAAGGAAREPASLTCTCRSSPGATAACRHLAAACALTSNIKGAYPFHWHFVGDAAGQMVTDCSAYRWAQEARCRFCDVLRARQLRHCHLCFWLLPRAPACRTYYRCFTIHATDNLLVQNNIGFHATGHCFYLEVRRLLQCGGALRWEGVARGKMHCCSCREQGVQIARRSGGFG